MKKKNVLKIAALIAMLPLASCLKKDVDPVTNKNSSLKLEGITFQNLAANTTTSLIGVAKFEFFNATDTTVFADTFDIVNPAGYTQNYDFDTPEKAKKFRFSIYFQVLNAGSASGVKVDNLVYKWNGTTHMQTPLTFTTTDNKIFTTNSQIVNF